MKIYKKIRFSTAEAKRVSAELPGYILVAMDARKGIISAGDEYLADLRDVLLLKRSKPEDIFAFGLDLTTGEIDYAPAINRRNPRLGATAHPSPAHQERIETLVRYFFECFEAFSSPATSSPLSPPFAFAAA